MRATKRQWDFVVVTELTRPPYGLHNVPVLGLHPSLSYRFRYAATDFQTASGRPVDLTDKWGLLVLRDRTVPEYIPARECRLQRLDEQGNIVFMELAFDRYVIYDPTKPAGQHSQIIDNALAQEGIQSAQNTSLGAYVVAVLHANLASIPTHPAPTLRDYATAWQNLVSRLAAKSAYRQARFFRLAALYPVGTDRALQPKPIAQLGGGYAVKGGTTYCLDVMHMATGALTPPAHDIAVKGSDQFFQFPKDKERADGEYDMIRLMLYVKPQASSKQNAVLTLESDQKIANQLIPPVFLPLEITWSLGTWLAKVIPVSCFFLGLAIILRVDWLASWSRVPAHMWALMGPILLGYGIGSFSLLANVLAPRLQPPES